MRIILLRDFWQTPSIKQSNGVGKDTWVVLSRVHGAFYCLLEASGKSAMKTQR
jgi:hypothetical protein